MQVNEFINGENLKKICDLVIDQNSINSKRTYKNNQLIFCKTDYLGSFFNEIKDDKNKYILISHQSDYEINERVFSYKPQNVKKWFAQNVNYQHPDLIPVPIGIENHEGPSKGQFIDLKELENYDIKEKYQKNNLLYSNFNVNNHQDRIKWVKQIESIGLNVVLQKKSFDNYVKDLKNSYFCSSPRGNGIDCHRTWESLYYDCIPIVHKHFIYNFFDAPIIQIEKETQITNNFLNELKNKYFEKDFEFDKNVLKLEYWADKINKTI